MSYLDPKYFVPNNKVLKKLHINKDQKYFIIRIVSLTSVHDVESKRQGISYDLLAKIINHLAGKGRIFISTEHPC